MSRLNDLARRVLSELRDETGSVKVHEAVKLVRPQLDEQDCERLIEEGIAIAIKRAGQETRRAALDASTSPSNGQHELFPSLRPMYALDVDGRSIKDTGSLSLLEFRRIIAIREKQLEDDRSHLEVLRTALGAVMPHWSINPSWTFAQACEAYRCAA